MRPDYDSRFREHTHAELVKRILSIQNDLEEIYRESFNCTSDDYETGQVDDCVEERVIYCADLVEEVVHEELYRYVKENKQEIVNDVGKEFKDPINIALIVQKAVIKEKEIGRLDLEVSIVKDRLTEAIEDTWEEIDKNKENKDDEQDES